MEAKASKSLSAIGFLTAAEFAGHGLVGGYLVVSPQGRPLEFRCTTPVRASRAQEILYGQTLRRFLLCEVVGHPLVTDAELHPRLILADQQEMLGLALLDERCIACVSDADCADLLDDGNSDSLRLNASRSQPPTEPLSLDRWFVTPAATCAFDESLIAELNALCGAIDLDEPFERIRLALSEVLTASPTGSDADDQSSAAA